MKKYFSRCLIAAGLLAGLLTGNSVISAAPQELSLNDSITLALKNNYTIHYANASREKSRWALKEAQRNKGVSVTFTHTDEHYRSPASTVILNSYVDTDYFENQISLSLPVYTGGKLENQIEQARQELQVADLEITAAGQQIRQETVSAYYTVLEYRNEVKVDRETVKNYEDHLNLVAEKYDLGMVAKTDVLSSQVDLATAKNNLIKAESNYDNALAALNNVMGLPHDTELLLKDDLHHEKYPLSLQECLSYAEANRPEIAQYKAKMANAQSGVKAAQSGYLPTVTLAAEQGWYDKQLVGTQNSNWLIKVTTTVNVFDSGLTTAKVQQEKHNVDMVANEAAKEQDSVLLEVRQYHRGMTEAEKRIENNKASVRQAEENLKIQQVRYEVGVGTNLDLTDSIVSLGSARKDQIQALYDFHTNRAQLERAIGKPVQ